MIDPQNIDFEKGGGLVPAIIQDSQSRQVLMLGYMNEDALKESLSSKKVTFWSRSKQRLWTKGEESGNFLHLKDIYVDCDQDSLLILAEPQGPVCHKGTFTCWGEQNPGSFLYALESVIQSRRGSDPQDSYTAHLFEKGTAKIAQKVGEEAVESVIEAMKGDKERLKEETADLLYHLLVLLSDQDLNLADVVGVLEARHKK